MVDVTTNLAPVVTVKTVPILAFADNWIVPYSLGISSFSLTDDNISANIFSLSGEDSSFFELLPLTGAEAGTGYSLHIKAGTVIDIDVPRDVIVTIDDPTLGTTHEFQQSFSVTGINPEPGAFMELLRIPDTSPIRYQGDWLITYSFKNIPDTPSSRSLTEAEKVFAREAFDRWSEVSGIVLVEVASGGDIKLDIDKEIHYNGYWVPVTQQIRVSEEFAGGLYVWVHEIGHALGLDHETEPSEEEIDTFRVNDRTDFTVMAYDTGDFGFFNRFYSYFNPLDSSEFFGIIGPLDIQATQFVYGVEDPYPITRDYATRTMTISGGTSLVSIPGLRVDGNPWGLVHIILGPTGDDKYSVTTFTDQSISSGEGNDYIRASAPNLFIDGGTGNDEISGAATQLFIDGGAGNDTISFSADIGTSSVTGGAGDDTLHGGGSPTTVVYSGTLADYAFGRVMESNDGFPLVDFRVLDKRAGSPDGLDLLYNVRSLFFEGSGGSINPALISTVRQNLNRTVTANEDQSITVTLSAGGLLPATFDSAGNPLSVVLLQRPINASPTERAVSISSYAVNPDGTYTLTPDANSYGVAYLLYAVTDGSNYLPGELKIVINPVNDAPVAAATAQILLTGGMSDPVDIGASDADADPLTYGIDGAAPAKGTVSFDAAAGSFVYTANPGASGTDSFTILISDGKQGFARQTVSVTLTEPGVNLTGSSRNDTLTGTERNDTLAGLGGSDKLNGLDGDDTIDGGTGNDHIDGGNGDDFIEGGDGNDKLTGGAGIDQILGGSGNDNIDGSSGDDAILGGLGADTITGGGGIDAFVYGSVAESSAAMSDHITDFSAADLIHLSQIDADTLADGQQAFTWIGTNAFVSGQSGALRAFQDNKGNTIIQGDTNGDARADLQIYLDNGFVVTASNLVLIA